MTRVGVKPGTVEGPGERILLGATYQFLAVGLFQGHVAQHHVHAVHVAVLVALGNEHRVPGADDGVSRIVEVHAVFNARTGTFHALGEIRAGLGAEQVKQRLAHDLLDGPAQLFGPAGVDELHPRVAIHEHQQQRQRIGQRGQTAVAATPGRLGHLFAGDVLDGGEIAADPTTDDHR